MYQKMLNLWSASSMTMHALTRSMHSKSKTKGGDIEMQNAHFLTGLVMVGLLLWTSKFAFATPTTNLLIADAQNHRVIEVDANHNILWQYGQTGVSGSGANQLNGPMEAVRLTNGNTLIADYGNSRVIEITPGKSITWQYQGPGGNFKPFDVRGLANGNVLIVDELGSRVLEVTPIYPTGGTIVWQCGAGTNIPLDNPNEAEKRPGTSTNYYLITDRDNHRVIEVQAVGTSGGTIVWQYGQIGVYGSGPNQLYWPADAKRLICNTILISDSNNNRVIEVSPTGTSGGTIVWECSASTGLLINHPLEAIRMSNWNTLIADAYNNRVIEVRTQDYPNFGTASILWEQRGLSYPRDVEELGIVNIAKAEYKDSTGKEMPREFAGIAIPLIPPVVNLPEIELSKDVSYIGTVTVGATLTYTIVYTNVGRGRAHNVEITDMIPDGTEYVVGSAQDTYGPLATESYSHDGGLNFDSSETTPVTHVRWTISTVDPGVSGTLKFQVVIR